MQTAVVPGIEVEDWCNLPLPAPLSFEHATPLLRLCSEPLTTHLAIEVFAHDRWWRPCAEGTEVCISAAVIVKLSRCVAQHHHLGICMLFETSRALLQAADCCQVLISTCTSGSLSELLPQQTREYLFNHCAGSSHQAISDPYPSSKPVMGHCTCAPGAAAVLPAVSQYIAFYGIIRFATILVRKEANCLTCN